MRLAPAACVVVLVLALAGSVAPSNTPPASSVELTEEQRRQQSLDLAPERQGEDVTPSVLLTAPARFEADPMPVDQPSEPDWPEASVTVVDLTAATAQADPVRGDTPSDGIVSVAPADPTAPPSGQPAGQVRVEVLGRSAAARAGIAAVLIRVEPVGAPIEAPLAVTVDYSGFADAYGGDWAARLRLVGLPECAATTPSRPECREQTVLPSTNDTRTLTLTATLDGYDGPLLGVITGPSGPTGNWSATSLSPSAAWQVSAQTGAFSWSYPMRVPPSPTGPAPDLALLYSSGSLDGRSAGANNQSSWVGDGWDLTTGYVERKYVPCSQDTGGDANNATHLTKDLCWSSDNATLVFDG